MVDWLYSSADWVRDIWKEILVGVIATVILTVLVKTRALVEAKAKQGFTRLMAWFLDVRPRAYRRLGLTPAEDINTLTAKLQTFTPLDKQSLPRSIVRIGLRWALDQSIVKRIGTGDPTCADYSWIDGVIQGPFCVENHHSLTFRDQDPFTGKLKLYFLAKCPSCGWQWSSDPKSSNIAKDLRQFKYTIYSSLDAEFRKTGTIVE